MATSIGNNQSRAGADVPLDFELEAGVYTACSESGREWRIAEERTGWRLEFRDPGDVVATNAGVHRSAQAAMTEASR